MIANKIFQKICLNHIIFMVRKSFLVIQKITSFYDKTSHPIQKNSNKMDDSEVKVVLLGQSNVGKTCIVNNLISGKFEDNVAPTLGASYASKIVNVDDQIVSLQIWDTAGQERFRVLTPMYYRGAHSAILVYSIIDEASFKEIDYWVESLREHSSADVELFLVGNKSDLESQRAITEEVGREKAKDIEAIFFETSALDGSGIDDLFLTVAKKYIETRKKTNDIPTSKTAKNVNPDDQNQNKGCC